MTPHGIALRFPAPVYILTAMIVVMTLRGVVDFIATLPYDTLIDAWCAPGTNPYSTLSKLTTGSFPISYSTTVICPSFTTMSNSPPLR